MGGARKVEQWKDGVLIAVHNHAKEASDILLINHPSSVTACCKGHIKTVKGWQFKYATVERLDDEVWVNHPIGLLVSSKGRFQFPGGHISSGSKHGLGYIQIHFKRSKHFAHRLVLEAFKGNAPVGMECDHIDRDRSNNSITNLRWVTKKENQNNRKCSKNLPLIN